MRHRLLCSARAAARGLAAILACASLAPAGAAQPAQEDLFARVVLAGKCKPTTRNGQHCDYVFGRTLSFSIRDAGDGDPLVVFSYSNANEDLFAIMVSGCVAVVPGAGQPPFDDKEYGVYVSPRTGRAYASRAECAAARPQPGN